MKFHVNDDCVGCGLCASICPEVFEMTDDGVAKAADAETEPTNEESAAEALDSCPVSAIERI